MRFGLFISRVFGSLATSGGTLLQKLVKRKVEIQPESGPEFIHFKYLVGVVVVVIGLICKTIMCAMLSQLSQAVLYSLSYVFTIGRQKL